MAALETHTLSFGHTVNTILVRPSNAPHSVLAGIGRARASGSGQSPRPRTAKEQTADERLSCGSSLWNVRDTSATETQAGYRDDAVAAVDPEALAEIERANVAIDAPLWHVAIDAPL